MRLTSPLLFGSAMANKSTNPTSPVKKQNNGHTSGVKTDYFISTQKATPHFAAVYKIKSKDMTPDSLHNIATYNNQDHSEVFYYPVTKKKAVPYGMTEQHKEGLAGCWLTIELTRSQLKTSQRKLEQAEREVIVAKNRVKEDEKEAQRAVDAYINLGKSYVDQFAQ